jgi:hypothetical protein
MYLAPALLSIVWLLNVRVSMSQEPVVMLRQGTVRGVSVVKSHRFVKSWALLGCGVEEMLKEHKHVNIVLLTTLPTSRTFSVWFTTPAPQHISTVLTRNLQGEEKYFIY